MKVRVVTATEAKNRFGDLIKSAYLRDEHLIVKRDGVPVVVIIPIADYEQFVNKADLPDALRAEMSASRKGLAVAKRFSQFLEFLESVHANLPDVTEEEAEKDIAEAIQAIRAKRAKKIRRASA